MEQQLELRRQEEAAKKNVLDTLKQQRQKLRKKEVCHMHHKEYNIIEIYIF